MTFALTRHAVLVAACHTRVATTASARTMWSILDARLVSFEFKMCARDGLVLLFFYIGSGGLLEGRDLLAINIHKKDKKFKI